MNELTSTDERQGLPSASGMKRLFLCPGSWQAEQMCPQDESSEEAMLGTMLHDCMEHGKEPENAEEAEAVQWCRETEERLITEHLQGESEERIIIREERMFDSERSFSGKPDLVVITGKHAFVIDYKFGRIPVEKSESNLQLAALAVLVNDNYGAETIDVAILQPYTMGNREPQVCHYGIEAIQQARSFFRASIARAKAPGAQLKPCEDACRYCRAMASCPAAKMLVVRNTVEDLNLNWEQWTPEKRREAYEVAKIAGKYKAAVERHIKTDLRAEVEIPGLELSAGRKMVTITDAAAAFSLLNSAFPDVVTAEAFTACCSVSITNLDKLIHTARKAVDAKAKTAESREWLRKTLEPFCEIKMSDGSIKEVKK